MDISIGSLIVSFLAGAPVGIAAWEALTNRSKLKLSLYEKRLEIFKGAHELYLILLRRGNENIDNALDGLTKKYREAKFLFNTEDGILELLREFRQEAFNIAGWQNRQAKDFTGDLADKITATQNRMENRLSELEKKFQPYLQAPSYSLRKDCISWIKKHLPFKGCIEPSKLNQIS